MQHLRRHWRPETVHTEQERSPSASQITPCGWSPTPPTCEVRLGGNLRNFLLKLLKKGACFKWGFYPGLSKCYLGVKSDEQ